MDKGGVKSAKIIEILRNARLQDSTQAPKLGCLLAAPRDIANIVALNRSKAKNKLANTEAAIEPKAER